MEFELRLIVAYSIIAVLVAAAATGAIVWRKRRRLRRLRQSGIKTHDPLYRNSIRNESEA